jgi:hypothetical protein
VFSESECQSSSVFQLNSNNLLSTSPSDNDLLVLSGNEESFLQQSSNVGSVLSGPESDSLVQFLQSSLSSISVEGS